MLPISPIGERATVAPLHAPAIVPASTAAPPGIAVDVSPLGQLLGTLALAQKRLGELAGAAVADPSADSARLGIATGELVEAFNLARSLPLPAQGSVRAPLTQAYAARRDVLAQAGIALEDDRLEVDSGRLLASFGADRQRTLAALAEAAAAFAEAVPAARPDPAPAARPAEPAPMAGARPAAPAAQAGEPDREGRTNSAADSATDPAADSAAMMAARRADEAAQSAAQAAQAAALARQQAARLAAQRELERQEATPVPQPSADMARADARRLADLQTSGTLESASQAALTQEARQAAYRLEVAREVANAEIAVQDDIATQDQRLMEARAAALRQLDSTHEQDLAAQALADRLARQRADTATALSEADRIAQARLDAARRAAARIDATAAPHAAPAPSLDNAEPKADRATLDEALRAAGDARSARDTPPPAPAAAPNAADPAVAAAIAAQRLAGGVAGGTGGPNPAPPPRTELVPPVRPVNRVTSATPLQGGSAGPRGTR